MTHKIKSYKIIHSKKVWAQKKNGMFGWMMRKSTEYVCSAVSNIGRQEVPPDLINQRSEKVGVFDEGSDKELMGSSVHMYTSDNLPGFSGEGLLGAETNERESLCEGENAGLD